jgi:hypothetical protein
MKESMGHLILSERHVKEKNKYEQVWQWKVEVRVMNMVLVNYKSLYKFEQGNNCGFDLEYKHESVVEEFIWKMSLDW